MLIKRVILLLLPLIILVTIGLIILRNTDPEEINWQARIDAAFAPYDCPEAKAEINSSSYAGPLIDTHLHIPAIPDGPSAGPIVETIMGFQKGRFGGPRAVLGENVTMTQIACTLKSEGTMDNFAFFPIYPEIPKQLLEIAKTTMQKYPNLFTAFIMPPGPDDVPPTVEAGTLQDMLAVHPELFEGYGEIGIYETENGRRDYPPDEQLFRDIYPIVRENKLLVYMHPGRGHKDNFATVLKENPDITFIVHGDEIEDSISALMDEYSNIYYTCDPSYSEYFPLYVGKNKEAFLEKVEENFDNLIEKDLKRWQSLIESHPDRFMWGTDRGDSVWNYDLDVGQFLVKYARAFIGRLDPSVQENFGYKNAQGLIDENRVN